MTGPVLYATNTAATRMPDELTPGGATQLVCLAAFKVRSSNNPDRPAMLDATLEICRANWGIEQDSFKHDGCSVPDTSP